MSLTVGLCDRLQIFEKLLENKHMNDTNNDTNMTGNADNRSELRTKSGQAIPRDRPWWHYPTGTKAPAHGGGHWTRETGGWKWCTGDVFPTPGGDNMDQVILPPIQITAPSSQALAEQQNNLEAWNHAEALSELEELRTQSGQGNPVSLSLRATYLWGTVLRIPFTAKQFWISLVSEVEAVTPSAIPSGRAGTGFCRPEVQPPPPPEPAPSDDVEEELEIRTCFMGHEFGEIEAVPLFRYRALQRALAEAQGELAAFKGFEHRTIKELAEQRDDALGRLEAVRKARNQFARKLDEVTKQRDQLVKALEIIASGGRDQFQWSLTKAESLARNAITPFTIKPDRTQVEKSLGINVVIDETVPNDTVRIIPPEAK